VLNAALLATEVGWQHRLTCDGGLVHAACGSINEVRSSTSFEGVRRPDDAREERAKSASATLHPKNTSHRASDTKNERSIGARQWK
jgi:hypothetical protein